VVDLPRVAEEGHAAVDEGAHDLAHLRDAGREGATHGNAGMMSELCTREKAKGGENDKRVGMMFELCARAGTRGKGGGGGGGRGQAVGVREGEHSLITTELQGQCSDMDVEVEDLGGGVLVLQYQNTVRVLFSPGFGSGGLWRSTRTPCA